MPNSTLTTFDDLAEQIGKGVHVLGTHTLKVALTNVAPSSTMAVLADITQIAASGGYTAGAGGGYALSGVSFAESSGLAILNATDLVITAAGGSVGPFRYPVIYNDTATSPADALIGFLDYGSALTLADTETLTLDFSASLGFLQITA
jgi:hypothetical protein